MFKRRIETLPVTFVDIDGASFRESEIYSLLDDLEDTDMVERVVIYDPDLKVILENREVIVTDIRGGSRRGPGYEEFCDEFSCN